MRVDAGLARLLGLSRTVVAELAEGGRVEVDGRAAGKSDRLVAGGWLEVELPDPPAPADITGPVNIGNPVELSLLELAKAVIEVTESRAEIVFEALPIDDPQVRQPDITRARQVLGWEPKVELRDGLRRTIEQAGVERLVGAAE